MLAFALFSALLIPSSPTRAASIGSAATAGIAHTVESTSETAVEPLYWSVPLKQVAWEKDLDAELLSRLQSAARSHIYAGRNPSWIVLDNGGEAFLYTPKRGPGGEQPIVRLVAHAPSGTASKGSLIYSQNIDAYGRIDFELSTESASPAAAKEFHLARSRHHRNLLNEMAPAGSSWFRHQMGANVGGAEERTNPFTRSRDSELVETFELFSGGRAVAENIQLDRLIGRRPTLPDGEQPKPDVSIDDIEGITVQEFDWSSVSDGSEPVALDPLLAWIPYDQHVLITSSFQAFLTLVDEVEQRASPLVAMLESSASNARSRAAMEQQLLLSLDAFTRLFGPALIKNVAITGSDLYMRTGTDITLLMDCREVDAVEQHLRKQYADAAGKDHSLMRTSAGGVEGIQSTFGDVSSFFAVADNLIVLSNSRASLERVLAAKSGLNLADLNETQFFRKRYQTTGTNLIGDETAFLMISDATIRRWCGPKWRIAASHRLQALAALLELHASHIHELVKGVASPRVLTIEDERLPDMGVVTLHDGGVHSSRYGSIGNLTPIVEMELNTVSATDARLYELWRDGYAQNWSGAFDPIAAQIAISEDAFEADLTVMPMIDNNSYREMRDWSGQAKLQPLDGDPHPGTLFHLAFAIDPNSEDVIQIQRMSSSMASDGVSKFLAWMSGSFSIFADDDEVWDLILDAQGTSDVWDELFFEINNLPLAITIGSSSPMKLASWMSALRSFAQGSAPGLTAWTPIEDDQGNAYVKISADNISENDEHLLYATLPEALVLSLKSDTLISIMERYRLRRTDAGGEQYAEPAVKHRWLGESVGLSISRKGMTVMGILLGDEFSAEAQRHTFANLPILNEWKRLFPEQDPVAVHRRIMKEELLCSAGGEFVWDEEWKTVASTVLGHPAVPKQVDQLSLAIGDLQHLDAGLTFEHDGLRARIRAQR